MIHTRILLSEMKDEAWDGGRCLVLCSRSSVASNFSHAACNNQTPISLMESDGTAGNSTSVL